MRAFVRHYHLDFFTHAVDPDGSLWAHFGVRAQPAWLFIAVDGTTDRAFGELSESDLEARLAKLSR